MSENDINFQADELGCELGEAFAASLRPAIFDRDGASFDPAEFAQPLHKSSGQLALRGRRSRAQESDGRQPRSLLRTRRQRPRRRAAHEGDELAAPHSITSSAEACRVRGTVRPSVFAVLRLMTSLNLVGCWTGRSAGFAPLRIRSTYEAARRHISA